MRKGSFLSKGIETKSKRYYIFVISLIKQAIKMSP